MELSVPVECLMSESPSKSPFSMYVLHDLTQLLHSIKEAFLDPRAVRALIDHLNYTIDKVYSDFHFQVFRISTLENVSFMIIPLQSFEKEKIQTTDLFDLSFVCLFVCLFVCFFFKVIFQMINL